MLMIVVIRPNSYDRTPTAVQIRPSNLVESATLLLVDRSYLFDEISNYLCTELTHLTTFSQRKFYWMCASYLLP